MKQNKNSSIICFVAGNSGGHIIPCLTLAQNYKAKNKSVEILFFSNNSQLDKRILSNNQMINKYVMLSISTFLFSKIYHYPKIIAQIYYSFITSFYHLYKHKPDRIITTGGLIALPVCFAAFFLRIPITVFELNAIPGKAVKVIAFFAQTIWYCFNETQYYFPPKKSMKKAYPIRFSTCYADLSPYDARKKLKLDPTKKTITILGGSQGSLFINSLIKQWVCTSTNMHHNIQLIHQTGLHDTTDWQKLYKTLSIPALVCGYQDNPALCYAASDLILCRAGAGTLFEVHFFKKQCITIPLKISITSHQINNAHAMATQYPNHYLVMEQKILHKNPQQLFSYLNEFYKVETIHCKQDKEKVKLTDNY